MKTKFIDIDVGRVIVTVTLNNREEFHRTLVGKVVTWNGDRPQVVSALDTFAQLAFDYSSFQVDKGFTFPLSSIKHFKHESTPYVKRYVKKGNWLFYTWEEVPYNPEVADE